MTVWRGGEFDRGRFFDVFALGDGVFGSAAAFAAFLDALVLPLLLPEKRSSAAFVFFGRGLVGRRHRHTQNLRVPVRVCGGPKKYMCSCQNLLDLRIQWILLVGGNLLNEQVQ